MKKQTKKHPGADIFQIMLKCRGNLATLPQCFRDNKDEYVLTKFCITSTFFQ